MEIIRLGSKGDAVRAAQKALGGLVVDGIFGAKTLDAVKAFQMSRGLASDGVVGPRTWAVLLPDSGFSLKRSKRVITEIIIHCSATPEGRDVTVADIDAMHNARGFQGIGYNYFVKLDGTVCNGRDVDRTGAHTTGHNAHSIGVCYAGGIRKGGSPMKAEDCKDTRTPEQKAALLSLVKELKRMYPGAKVYGHRDFAAKACPCFDAKTEYAGV